MLPKIEIIISGNTAQGTTGGTLDLYGNEPINLILSNSSIKDPTQTKSPFSQEFVIPSTPNNDTLLSHLFYIGSDSNFDSRKKARAYILVDSIQVMQGNMQVTGISNKNMDSISYKVMIFGETNDLFTKIEGQYLTDLNWSELNHTLNQTNIVNSWTNTPSSGYYYPLIDYSYGWDYYALNNASFGNPAYPDGIMVTQMFPALYNEYIMKKIFSAAGFTYASNFFSSSTFNQTIVPFNGDSTKILDNSFCTGKTFQVQQLDSVYNPSVGSYSNIAVQNIGGTNYNKWAAPPIAFGNPFINTGAPNGNPNFDNGGLYTGAFPISFYTANAASVQDFTAVVQYSQPGAPIYAGAFSRQSVIVNFFRSTFMGGATQFYQAESPIINTLVAGQLYSFSITTPTLNQSGSTQFGPIQPGETVWCTLSPIIYNKSAGASPTAVAVEIWGAATYWFNKVYPELVNGSTIPMNNLIPSKILQTDYLKSIINQFNIYVEPTNGQANRLIMEPRTDYFANGETKDWTLLLDNKRPISQKILSEMQQKKYKFTYSDDKDYFNKHYKDQTNETYGQYIYDFENDFTTETKEIKSVFASCPVSEINGAPNIVIPVIETLESSGAWKRTDSIIRFLRKNPTPKSLYQGQSIKFFGNGTTYPYYPYAGHLDDPFSGTTDYNFGQVNWVYYTVTGITNNNLVNNYWKPFLDGIGDKDSRQVTAYFKLEPRDINQFKFSDTIFVDGLTSDGGHYFIVDSIEYSPTSSESTKVVLLKIPNKTVSLAGNAVIPPGDHSDLSGRAINIGSGQIVPYSINVGLESVVSSPGGVSVGNANTIMPSSDGSVVFGSVNVLNSGNQNSFVSGNFNTFEINNGNTQVFGSYNAFETGATNNFVLGNYNVIQSGVTGSTLLNVNNYTATTSDQTFATNITVLSAITLPGGVVISAGTIDYCAIGGLKTPYISGCSQQTLIDLNGGYTVTTDNGGFASDYLQMIPNAGIFVGTTGSTNISGGDISFASNSFASNFDTLAINSITQDVRIFHTNGLNQYDYFYAADNTLTGRTSTNNAIPSVFIGTQNSTFGTGSSNTILFGGLTNSVQNNAASSGIFGGQMNTIYGNQNIILGGASNTVFAFSNSSIVAGTNNNISGGQSVIAGGNLNYAFSNNNFIGGGNQNSTLNGTGDNNAIIGGTLNYTSGTSLVTNAVVLAGSGMTATTSNTVYLPKLKLQPVTTTTPSPEKGMMFFSGGTFNRMMYNSGGTANDWVIF